MRILVAGSFKYSIYDEACAHALEGLGCEVIRFPWQPYYGNGLLARVQQKWLTGPGIYRLNKDIRTLAREVRPDVVLVTRGVPLWSMTLSQIKRDTQAILVSNNNDDPFGQDFGKPLWRHFIKAIYQYDIHFVFRGVNIAEYEQYGAKSVYVLMPYYVPELHFPVSLTVEEIKRFSCDIVFVGHAKDDARIIFLQALADQRFDFRLYGWHWDRLFSKYSWLREKSYPPVWEFDYNRVISAAKIGLVFFTRGNRDTYTRRVFEIPAIGTCMLSERTEDMGKMFREGSEAVYFSMPSELVQRAGDLVKDHEERNRIAQNAKQRLHELKASVYDRMRQVLAIVENHRN